MTQIPYGRQWIDQDDIDAVTRVLRSDFLTQGPEIAAFESELAAYAGARYSVLFNSGTSALHGAYYAAGLKADDEFITSPITFVATANAGLYLGARPVFADIEPDTGNLDPTDIEARITDRTRLIVPVHFAGHPADMERIYALARPRGITVIEDACHALGAEYKGRRIGSSGYSDMTVLSFHPVKHITTGEGGAVVTDDEGLYRKLLMFRSHGITRDNFIGAPHGQWYYEMQLLGFNYRMTDIGAALGRSQLKKADRFLSRRREIAVRYDEVFAGSAELMTPAKRDYARHAYHLYFIRLADAHLSRRAELFARLRAEGLGVQVHYTPVYLQPFYRNLGYREGLCPNAEDFYCREISIPMFQSMTDAEQDVVIARVKGLF